MQYDRYPFIDLAVHKDIRERFARGEALAVTSPDLGTVVWANGPAADLFGYSSIYELIDDGIDTRPAIKRQIAGAIVGLARKDGQSFLIRVAHGFRRETVPAHVQLIELPGGPPAVLISAERDYPGGLSARARQIISGFDDGDAHVAVIDDAGTVLAGSTSFDGAELSESDLQRMARDVAQQPDRLVKRMIDSAGGKKPAAIGRLTDDPALNLVFVVETGADEDEPDHDQQPEATKATEPPPLPIFGADAVREELDASRPPEVQYDIPVAFASSREITSESDEAWAHDQEAHETNGGRRFEDDPLWDEVPPQPPLDGGADTTMDAEDDEVAASDPEATFADEQADEQATTKDDFIFDPDGRPVRFVWKIDRTGTFSELSPEFALAIGPNAADIIGRNFPDVARVFNLDPDHVITDLLSRRDTWSGKTVYWPIQGTDLMVPVDLAALPTYTRERRFDGFRGFGIVRIGEAQPDPESIGLALVPGPWTPIARRDPAVEDERSNEHNDTIETADPAAEEMDVAEIDGAQAEEPETSAAEPEFVPANDDSATSEEQSETDGDDRDEDAVTAEVPSEPGVTESTAHEAEDEPAKDPFQGETPALAFSPNQGRRENDKVIDLEARRSRSRDTLSPLEQAAFREIGEKLGIGLAAASTPSEPDDVPSSEGAASESPAKTDEEPTAEQVPEAPEEVSALFDNVDGPVNDPAGSDDEDVREEDVPVAAAPSEPDDSTEPSGQTDSNTEVTSDDDGSVADDDAVQHDDGTVTDPDEDESDGVDPVDEAHDDGSDEASDFVAPPSLYEFQLPSRHQTSYGLTEDLVDMIPAALLVHAGDRLIHGNPEFLKFTGFTSLEDLAEAGGLDILLSSDEETGAMRMRTQSGTERTVVARLRSINWYNSQALLLSLSQKPEAAPEPAAADLSEAPPAAENIAAFPAVVPLDGAEQSSYLERINSLEIEARELRSILETATDGVVIIGEDNRIRSMNGSAHALFGYDDTETLEQPFAMLFAHESQRAVMDYLGGLAEHGVSSVLNDGREVIGREANGGLSPLFMTIGRLSGSNGFCAVLRDITQWKRSEEELRDAKRAAETANSHKSDFLARVSHEIRTPLNAIIGFSEMMVEERFGPIGSPRYLEYANDIGNSGKHVLDIVNDLLDISKIEAGEVDLDFGAVTLNDQLAECVSMLQPLANSQRVIIRTSLSATLPEVVADPRSIKQIALNLLSNAIRYTPSGGQIVVSTGYETNGNVVLRIRDTGIGMTRKELEQAMKPFGQVGPTPRKRGDGTGLGLPLTKAMVEANRAQFDIISAPKEGTLVTITFPSQRVLAD
jgi:PAS domain S-box-containing protein